MKTVSILMGIFLASLAVNAVPSQSVTSNLTIMNFQTNSWLSQQNIKNGEVEVNFSEQKITLTLFRPWSCPVGAMCSLLMPSSIVYEVPLTSDKTGPCNTTIYSGSVDQRLVDGNLQKITVVDNSKNYCKRLITPDEMTNVKLQIRSVRSPSTEVHSLNGSELTFAH